METVYFSEEEGLFRTYPDGDVATHRQIHDHFIKIIDMDIMRRISYMDIDNHIPHID